MTAALVAAVCAAWAVLLWPRRQGAGRGQSALDMRATPQPAAGIATDISGGVAPSGAHPRPDLAMAEVVDLLVLVLRAGGGVLEALEAVGRRVGGRHGKDLLTVAAAERWGVDAGAAWSTVSPTWRPVAQALRLAASAGIPPAAQLASAADQLRRAEIARLEQATAALGVRLVLPLGLAFLPAFVLTTVVPVVLALARQVLRGA